MHLFSPLVAALVAAVTCFLTGVAISFAFVRAGKVARVEWRAGIFVSLAVGALVFAQRSGWF